MADSVIIVSGGMDSVTLLHYLVKREGLHPALLSFTYGQKHLKEIAYARENAALLGLTDHQILDLTPMSVIFKSSALVSDSIAIPTVETVMGDPQPPTYVPNRNMIFLALAVAYGESLGVADIYYGAQKHDIYSYWDTTKEFLDSLNNVYRLNRKAPIQIKAPFVTFSKADILRTGLELDVDYAKTWSCYAGGDRACGVCPTCAERLAAFKAVGIPDPLPYAI
ncbi:MAG TPA: 7-cyano-7-deazaguanine synthase QueC [Aggregatilineales bacterium]|nr:7-cyano-7-deazaguanine synthase QueC [Aggregatilineales bacterium]